MPRHQDDPLVDVRKRLVLMLRIWGFEQIEIAKILRITTPRVCQILKSHGITGDLRQPLLATISEIRQVKQLSAQGHDWTEIGLRLGKSRSWVITRVKPHLASVV